MLHRYLHAPADQRAHNAKSTGSGAQDLSGRRGLGSEQGDDRSTVSMVWRWLAKCPSDAYSLVQKF